MALSLHTAAAGAHVAEDFDDARDAGDPSYIHGDLEQWLREICPRYVLGEYYCDEPQLSTLLSTAWKSAARVLLGTSERDGQRADELFNSAVRLWDMVGNGPKYRPPLTLDRKAALTFLEAWREAALSCAFRGDETR